MSCFFINSSHAHPALSVLTVLVLKALTAWVDVIIIACLQSFTDGCCSLLWSSFAFWWSVTFSVKSSASPSLHLILQRHFLGKHSFVSHPQRLSSNFSLIMVPTGWTCLVCDLAVRPKPLAGIFLFSPLEVGEGSLCVSHGMPSRVWKSDCLCLSTLKVACLVFLQWLLWSLEEKCCRVKWFKFRCVAKCWGEFCCVRGSDCVGTGGEALAVPLMFWCHVYMESFGTSYEGRTDNAWMTHDMHDAR